MIMRVSPNHSKGNLPKDYNWPTGDHGPAEGGDEGGERTDPHQRGLLSARAAGILGASFIVAMGAGGLTYLVVGTPVAGLAAAGLAAGAAFAGAIRLLIAIIALPGVPPRPQRGCGAAPAGQPSACIENPRELS
jgi:hypothetical protein